MAMWATASIQSRGVSPRLRPRSNSSASEGISANTGSSASLSNSRRATSASRRSTTTLVRSAASTRASCIACLSAERGSAAGAAANLSRLPHMAGLLRGPQAVVWSPTRRYTNASPQRRPPDRRSLGNYGGFARELNPRREPARSAAGNDAVRPRPGEPLLGASARAVLAADKARITEPVEQSENFGIVHLAPVRLAARGHGCDLNVADKRQVRLEAADEVAADDLHVIEVELNAQVRRADPLDDIGGVFHAAHEIIRAVARI